MFNAMIEKEKNRTIKWGKQMNHHPFATFFMVFLGMPAVVLVAVSACITMVMFPVALILGWL